MKNCPKCDSDNLIAFGKVKGKQRYLCKDCNKTFSVEGKSDLISKSIIDKMYKDYQNKYHSLTQFKERRTLIYYWMKKEYWSNPENSYNIFSKVGRNSYYAEDLIKFFKNVKSTINVKPLADCILVQYLEDGKKTEIQKIINLFKLRDIRETKGEVYFTVVFNILNTTNNKARYFDSNKKRIYLAKHKIRNYPNLSIKDFVKEDDDGWYLTKINPDVKNVLRNVTISDFLLIISEPEHFDLLIKLSNLAKQRAVNLKGYSEWCETLEGL
ncbi:MAG TPA: hypothetical protein VN698_07105 [Bacteroidia bacterium]|nr:hypothetical protein [Bacteroidia bacterium]